MIPFNLNMKNAKKFKNKKASNHLLFKIMRVSEK